MKFTRILAMVALLMVIGSSSIPAIAKKGTVTPGKPVDGAITQDYG